MKVKHSFFSFSVKLLDWGEEGHRSDAEIASLRAAFTQEVAVWHKLEHPNVTKVIFHVFTILFCFHFFHHFHGVLKELKNVIIHTWYKIIILKQTFKKKVLRKQMLPKSKTSLFLRGCM